MEVEPTQVIAIKVASKMLDLEDVFVLYFFNY